MIEGSETIGNNSQNKALHEGVEIILEKQLMAHRIVHHWSKSGLLSLNSMHVQK